MAQPIRRVPATHHLLATLLLIAVVTTHALPPPSPIACNATGCLLSNSYGVWPDRRSCPVQTVLYPSTEADLVASVAVAIRDNKRIKSVSAFSHTIPRLACPPSDRSGAVLISTSKLSTTVTVDASKRTVTADAGVGLRDLLDKLEAAEMSLVAAPYWEGVSVAGMISTGSHGSSWWGRGGAVHDYVVGLRIVVPAKKEEGYAKVLELTAGDPLLHAARVSLGLLGVISKVTLAVEPAFKRSITHSFRLDDHIEDDFADHARQHEFADITWYPSQGKAVYRVDDRAPSNATGDGVYDFIGFQANPILVTSGVRALEKLNEASRSVKGKCAMAAAETAYKQLVANGLKNNGVIFTGYPVVGRQSKMQTSGSCLHSPAYNLAAACSWDPRYKVLFFYETTAFFSPAKFRAFVQDVKKLRDVVGAEAFCGMDGYNGFLFRFVKASSAFLGQSEDSVAVDFNYFRADEASTPRLGQDVLEEVEQMAFFKYGARPHWGKNRKAAFLGAAAKYPKLGEFVRARKKVDSGGVFGGGWWDEVVLMGKEGAKYDGCAMEGECICSEDRHCNPAAAYVCRPGIVYGEARVCRYLEGSYEKDKLS